MNPEIAKKMLAASNSSTSSEKLAIVMMGLAELPSDKLNKLKKFDIKWRDYFMDGDSVLAPDISMEFE